MLICARVLFLVPGVARVPAPGPGATKRLGPAARVRLGEVEGLLATTSFLPATKNLL